MSRYAVLSTGHNVNLVFRVFGARFPILIFVSLLFAAPTLFLTSEEAAPAEWFPLEASDPGAAESDGLGALDVFLLIYPYLSGAILGGILSYVVIQYLHRKRLDLGRLIGITLQKAIPLLIAVTLSLLLVALPILAPIGIFAAVSGEFVPIGDQTAVFFLLIIPGGFVSMWLMLCVALTTPVVVTETSNPLLAIRRSFQLTRGCRMSLVSIYIVMGLAMFVAAVAGAVLITVAFQSPSILGKVFENIVAIPAVLVPAVAYCSIRRHKEGATGEDLVAIFD